MRTRWHDKNIDSNIANFSFFHILMHILTGSSISIHHHIVDFTVYTFIHYLFIYYYCLYSNYYFLGPHPQHMELAVAASLCYSHSNAGSEPLCL